MRQSRVAGEIYSASLVTTIYGAIDAVGGANMAAFSVGFHPFMNSMKWDRSSLGTLHDLEALQTEAGYRRRELSA